MGNELKLESLLGNELKELFQTMFKASCRAYLKEVDNVSLGDVAFYFDVSEQTIRKNKGLFY